MMGRAGPTPPMIRDADDPGAGVAVAIPAFVRAGDRRYAAIAGIVLAMLLVSLLLSGGVA